jgi:hypothetical protein
VSGAEAPSRWSKSPQGRQERPVQARFPTVEQIRAANKPTRGRFDHNFPPGQTFGEFLVQAVPQIAGLSELFLAALYFSTWLAPFTHVAVF